jgi:hypothetical protein
MGRMPRKRRLWKTFIFRTDADAMDFVSVAPNAGDSRPGRRIERVRNFVETNIPWSTCRAMARVVGLKLPQAVTSPLYSGDDVQEDDDER